MRGNLSSFVLQDGSTYWYDQGETWMELFGHGSECLQADYEGRSRPDPPQILRAVANAKDRRLVVERLYPQGSLPLMAYDVDVLIESGEFVPRSFLAGVEYGPEYFARLANISGR